MSETCLTPSGLNVMLSKLPITADEDAAKACQEQVTQLDSTEDAQDIHVITPAEENVLARAFATIDFDGGGSISFDELIQAFT